MELSLQKLVAVRASYGDFKSAKKGSHVAPLNAEILFDSSRPLPSRVGGVIDAPFLVPAILDRLGASEYSSITEVVPGEADPYCAAAARSTDSIVLTNDSDLLVYDLGEKGALTSFSSIELQSCEDRCRCLRARLQRPVEIAKQLGLSNLIRLAFELSEDYTITLNEAVKRSKLDIEISARISAFRDFGKLYCLEPIQSHPPGASIKGARKVFMDARVSELILQYRSPSHEPVYMFLPVLIDDPSRSSAWAIAMNLRRFAYALLTQNSSSVVLEYGRRGSRIQPTMFQTEEGYLCTSDAATICRRLSAIDEEFGPMPAWLTWRIFGMMEVFSWYLEGRTLPPSNMSSKAFVGRDEIRLSWQDIHLAAQLEAALYSVRILKQVLGYVIQINGNSALPELLELYQRLASLPPLGSLMPSRTELINSSTAIVTTDQVLKFIINDGKTGGDQAQPAKGKEVEERSTDPSHVDVGWMSIKSTKRKCQKFKQDEGGTRKHSAHTDQRSDNPYSVLA